MRLFSAGLGEIVFGGLCISQFQSGYPCPVQSFDIIRAPRQNLQAVFPYPSKVNTLFLQQTSWTSKCMKNNVKFVLE